MLVVCLNVKKILVFKCKIKSKTFNPSKQKKVGLFIFIYFSHSSDRWHELIKITNWFGTGQCHTPWRAPVRRKKRHVRCRKARKHCIIVSSFHQSFLYLEKSRFWWKDAKGNVWNIKWRAKASVVCRAHNHSTDFAAENRGSH